MYITFTIIYTLFFFTQIKKVFILFFSFVYFILFFSTVFSKHFLAEGQKVHSHRIINNIIELITLYILFEIFNFEYFENILKY